ncbi:MAG: hypothetical protein AAF628_12755 [Planctomycetota bacterium]
MTHPTTNALTTSTCCLLSVLTACGDADAQATGQESRPTISAPTVEIELPELPYDKAELSEVGRLDAMIADSQRLAASVDAFRKMLERLEEATQVSMSGTSEDQVKAVMSIVDGFRTFDAGALAFGHDVLAAFKKDYESDDAFATRYREIYSKAEEQVSEVIQDGPKRRATGAAMMNTYRYLSGANSGALEHYLEEAAALRDTAIDRVVQSAQTDLMVADYKKGKDLTDLLATTKNCLALIQQLRAEDERITTMLTQVADKEVSRHEEVAAARAARRFPSRYAGANAPANAEELEAAMRDYLAKSGYDVRGIALASEWIAIHSVLGIHLYDQIDFYVAAAHSDDEGELLDILYVTGKTGRPDPGSPFVTYSVGGIGEMLANNL